ncbi:MAG: efflux RND transporter periplasmic adaptor subunit [Opitutaceae bacterium]
MKLLLCLFALALTAGCSRPGPAAVPAPGPAVRVRVAAVEAAEVRHHTEATGTVRPVRRAVLAPQVAGTITELPAALGQPVRAGEVLVRLTAADAQARLTRAEVQLKVARRDLAREQDLLARGASTAETVRNLEDRVTGCETMVREAEAQLGYTTIRAAFDGVVARRLVHPGDLASPGQPLLEIEGTADLELEAAVPESAAAALVVGVKFDVTAAGRTFPATLREVSSTADAATRTIGVKLAVPAGAPVRSGQFVRVLIPGDTRPAVLVPAAAVALLGQMERVFVVPESGPVQLRLVRTGARRGAQIEVLAGLAARERVVLAPPADLRDGQPVEVIP